MFVCSFWAPGRAIRYIFFCCPGKYIQSFGRDGIYSVSTPGGNIDVGQQKKDAASPRGASSYDNCLSNSIKLSSNEVGLYPNSFFALSNINPVFGGRFAG